MSESAGWAKLQQLFVRRLHERISLMTATAAKIEQGNAEARAEMRRQFHSLAGIGGTFGYPSISDLAREGEMLCASNGGNVRIIVERLAHAAAEVAE